MNNETNEDWKNKLDPLTYHVTREKGTEPAFSGKYVDNKEAGKYMCSNCGIELFASDTKFDSGSGWPSFYKPAAEDNVELKPDDSLGMHRTEVVCKNCGAHLGHLFDDAPDQPTGQRYCINSCALDFKEGDK